MKVGSSLCRRIRWPKTLFGRALFAIGVPAVCVLALLGLVAGSVWVEHRYPSDEPGRAMFPRAQGLVTRPIVEALGREIQSHYRRKSEARYLATGLSLREVIERFLDPKTAFAARRDHAFRLAREGTPEALAALRQVLASATADDRAFIATLVGRAGNPDTVELLATLTGDPDREVARAAIRALGLIGGKAATDHVAGILADPESPQSQRIESAVTLGAIGTTASQLALVDALDGMPAPGVAAEILNGLGGFDFDRVAPTFRSYLSAQDADAGLRVVAVEALSKSSPDAVPFLLEMARADRDPEVRASAAWAISTHQTIDHVGEELVDMTANEAEQDVRRRLYEALLNQAGTPAARILPLVREEQDPAARVAGLNVLGKAAREHPGSPEAAAFDAELVPELQDLAVNPNTVNLQMRAVFALRRAGTPAARQALAEISQSAAPAIASAARHGLNPSP